METNDNDAPRYRVWGLDDVAYGPVELPVLTNWVLDERVAADTWVSTSMQYVSFSTSRCRPRTWPSIRRNRLSWASFDS